VIDHGGFYERSKYKFTVVQDSLCVGACAPPGVALFASNTHTLFNPLRGAGGGRNRVTPRLFRHFHMLWMPQLAGHFCNHGLYLPFNFSPFDSILNLMNALL
jgi:dynein heavy chain, axonemal